LRGLFIQNSLLSVHDLPVDQIDKFIILARNSKQLCILDAGSSLQYRPTKRKIQTSTGMFYIMCNYSSLWRDEVPSATLLCIVTEIEQGRQLGQEKHKLKSFPFKDHSCNQPTKNWTNGPDFNHLMEPFNRAASVEHGQRAQGPFYQWDDADGSSLMPHSLHVSGLLPSISSHPRNKQPTKSTNTQS